MFAGFRNNKKLDCWCCDGLKHMFAERHGRSIYVFAEPPIERMRIPVSFWLAMRSVEHKHFDKLDEMEFTQRFPVTVATRVPIKYCPWCGRDLLKFYGRNYQHLLDEAITAEHAALRSEEPVTETMSPSLNLNNSLELALHRALRGEVPPNVHAIIADLSRRPVQVDVYSQGDCNEQLFTEVVESELEQCCPTELDKSLFPIVLSFHAADTFDMATGRCLLYLNHHATAE